jgi:enamine deaminase RidA (YjgF/YER057c/UK114 family)
MNTQRRQQSTALVNLERLGYALPEPAPSRPEYVEYRQVGHAIHIAGQLPFVDGDVPVPGRLGRDVELDQAQELARLAVLQVLGVAASAVGGLDRVRMVQLLVFVASTPDYARQSAVADAASSLLVDVLGENGKHARTAIGVAGLPRNSPVEIQAVCTAVSEGS